MGSWKIMAMSLPRMARTRSLSAFSRSSPSKRMLPLRIRAGGEGTSPRIDLAVTDLPQPVSPTMPRDSPWARSMLTSSMAL